MTLADLEVWIAAAPNPAAILLTEPDWRATMEDPAAAEHIQFRRGDLKYVYRGLPVFIALVGRSRIIGRAEVERDRWV